MKKICCFALCVLFILSAWLPAVAEDKDQALPTIDSLLRSGEQGKTEVSDRLDGYHPLNEAFTDVEYDIKMIILQRDAPLKEFTEKTDYPPFTNADGFDDSFTGTDLGEDRVWLRADLMAQLPASCRAGSMEEATYLLVAENLYEWDGTISSVNYKNNNNAELPEFKDAGEMEAYFLEHPKEVESINYYPKFGAYSIITLYETKTKRAMIADYQYTGSMRFARNPEAGDLWSDMGDLDTLLDSLESEEGVDAETAKGWIGILGFVPEETRNQWISSLDAGEYPAAAQSVSEYYWTMAGNLRALDPSRKNRDNYDLIISARNRSALQLFANYCDYSGFDRSISSIESSGDYIASPDTDWVEQGLNSLVALFNGGS